MENAASTPRLDRCDISDQRDIEDNTEPAESQEPIEKIDSAEPTLPIEAKDPTLPMDSTEPWDAIDSTLPSDHRDHRDDPVTDPGGDSPAAPLIPSACQQPSRWRTRRESLRKIASPGWLLTVSNRVLTLRSSRQTRRHERLVGQDRRGSSTSAEVPSACAAPDLQAH